MMATKYYPIYVSSVSSTVNPRLFCSMEPYSSDTPRPEILLPIGCSKEFYTSLLSKVRFSYPKYQGDDVNAVLVLTSAINGFVYRVVTGEINTTHDRVCGLRDLVGVLRTIVTGDMGGEWKTVRGSRSVTAKQYVTRMFQKLSRPDMRDVFDPIYQFLPLVLIIDTVYFTWNDVIVDNFVTEVEKRKNIAKHKHTFVQDKWDIKDGMISIYFKLISELSGV